MKTGLEGLMLILETIRDSDADDFRKGLALGSLRMAMELQPDAGGLIQAAVFVRGALNEDNVSTVERVIEIVQEQMEARRDSNKRGSRL